MERTTIMISAELKGKAVSMARKMNISLGELMRKSIERFIDEGDSRHTGDPFFTDRSVFQEDVERDLALNHDKYIYGE